MKNLYTSLLGIASRPLPAEALEGNVSGHYCLLVRKTLLQFGISCEPLQIELRCVDKARDGKPVYAAMIYMAQWERDSALRLLVGLPLIEVHLREEARSSWMSCQSHFVGLWLHASARLEAPDELRRIVVQLTSEGRATSRVMAAMGAELQEDT